MHLYTGLNNFNTVSRAIHKISGNKYSADFGFGKRFLLTATKESNLLNFKIQPANKLSSLYFIGEIGVDIDLPADTNSVSWLRNSLYSDYPENHIVRMQVRHIKTAKYIIMMMLI